MGGNSSQERHHHYVAAFHLAGFTDDGTKTGRLYVIDRELSREWLSSPVGTAKKREYNAVEAMPDQNVVERAFGQIEGEAASIFREMLRTRKIPDRPALDSLINYVALAAARVPRVREVVAAVTDRFLKDHFRQVFNAPEAFKTISQEFAALGVAMNQEGFSQLRQHMLGDEVQMSLDQTTMVMTTFQAAAEFVPHLSQRRWMLAILNDDAPDLICSDCPVSVVPPAIIPLRKMPDLRDRDTLVILPLNKRMIVLGTYMTTKPVAATGRFEVACLNRYAAEAARQVFHAGGDFAILSPDRQSIWDKSQFMASFR